MVALLVSTLLPFNAARAADTGTVSITIVHTNDTHGRIKESDNDGMGFAKLAAKIDELRAANKNVLVLDAGDTFHGQTIVTIPRGESIVKIMNDIKYDAMVPGNHDFNYGQDRLVELSKIAEFPILSANIVKKDGTKLLDPYIIKEFDGIKVGIFGLSTPETAYMTNPKNVEGLTFDDPVKAAKETISELNGKCDIVIALAHLGLNESSLYTSKKVAEQVDGIDLIVDGHSHTQLDQGLKVNDTLIVQTGEYDKNLGIVNITCKDKKIDTVSASLFTKEQASSLPEDEGIKSITDEVDKENAEMTSVVVGNTPVLLDGERGHVRTGETNLGDLITDAMIDATGADVAITNGGGIRASIDVGDITKGEVITVLPFGNYVVLKEVKGSDILAALEHGISSYPEQKGAFPHVAGLTFTFDPQKSAGSRVTEVKVGNSPLEPDKIYKLATNDFMAVGGDEYTMLKEGKTLGEYPGLDDILAGYIQKYEVKDAAAKGRITVYKPQTQPEPQPELKLEPEQQPQPDTKTEPKIETYVVQPGDVLWKIAQKFGSTWQKLAEYNKLQNPNLIFPGQKIAIPAN